MSHTHSGEAFTSSSTIDRTLHRSELATHLLPTTSHTLTGLTAPDAFSLPLPPLPLLPFPPSLPLPPSFSSPGPGPGGGGGRAAGGGAGLLQGRAGRGPAPCAPVAGLGGDGGAGRGHGPGAAAVPGGGVGGPGEQGRRGGVPGEEGAVWREGGFLCRHCYQTSCLPSCPPSYLPYAPGPLLLARPMHQPLSSSPATPACNAHRPGACWRCVLATTPWRASCSRPP